MSKSVAWLSMSSVVKTPKSVRIEEKKEAFMAKDPVCNMDVEEATAQWSTEYQGKTYYFCAPGCKKAFEENPQNYLDG